MPMPFMAKKIRGPVVFTPEEIPKPLSLQVVTWNVGNAEPDNDLTNLLGPKGEGRARMCDRWVEGGGDSFWVTRQSAIIQG